MTCLCCVNCEWTLARLALTWSIRSEWNILEPMDFPETRLYTHKCSTFQCAQRYLEKRRNYVRRTSHIAHHIYIRLVVVPGLRIRQRQFYLCWMLFDEFLFIFFSQCFGVWCLFWCFDSERFGLRFVCLSPFHLFVWNVSQSHWHSDLDSGILGAVQIRCRCYFTFDSKMWKPNKMDLIYTFVRFKRIVCVPFARILKCAGPKNRFLYLFFYLQKDI